MLDMKATIHSWPLHLLPEIPKYIGPRASQIQSMTLRRSISLPQVVGFGMSGSNLPVAMFKFDLSTLPQLAASAIRLRSCARALKISEGQYSKVFQLTMDDGRVVAAILPSHHT